MGETRNNLSRCYYTESHASKWSRDDNGTCPLRNLLRQDAVVLVARTGWQPDGNQGATYMQSVGMQEDILEWAQRRDMMCR